MLHLISFSKYQTKFIIKFLFRQLKTSNFKIFLGSTSKAMAKLQKFKYLKLQKRNYKNLNISRTKRAF